MFKKIIAYSLLFLFCLVVYATTIKGIRGNVLSQDLPRDVDFYGIGHFESSHERASYATLLAIFENHTVELNRDLADFGSPDVGFFKGSFYSYFPPGVAVISLPLFIFGLNYGLSLILSYFTISIIAALGLVLFYVICTEIFSIKKNVALFCTCVVGFASSYFPYAITLYQHIPTAFLFLLAFYSVWRYKQAGKYSWVWTPIPWICYGLSFFFDYPNVLLLSPIAVYHLMTALRFQIDEKKTSLEIRSSYIFSIVFFIAILGAHIYYNQYFFGNSKVLTNTFARYTKGSYEELVNQDSEKIAADKSQTSAIFRETNIIKGVNKVLFSVDKGLFIYFPIFALSIFGFFIRPKSEHLEKNILISAVLVNIFLYSSFGDPAGGLSYGPRYLVLSMVILPIFLGLFLSEKKWYWLKSIFAWILYIYSAGVALLGVLTRSIVFNEDLARTLNVRMDYFINLKFLRASDSDSLAYNLFFKQHVTLTEYLYILLGIFALVGIVTLFIWPLFSRSKNDFS